MKQPEVFKNFRESWTIERQMYNYDEERIKELNKIIDKAKEELELLQKRVDERLKEREEVLKYFEYIDGLDESKH